MGSGSFSVVPVLTVAILVETPITVNKVAWDQDASVRPCRWLITYLHYQYVGAGCQMGSGSFSVVPVFTVAILVETSMVVDTAAWEQDALVGPADGLSYFCNTTNKWEQGAK